MRRALSFDKPEELEGRMLVAVFPDESIYCGYYKNGRLKCYSMLDADRGRFEWSFNLEALKRRGATVWEEER